MSTCQAARVPVFRVVSRNVFLRKNSAKRTDDLFCFANDLDSKYGNNRGALHVEIKRES